MSKAKELDRNYSKTDSEMQEQSQTMCDNLKKYIGDFTPKFPFIDIAYANKFQLTITEGVNFITDRGYQDDTHVETTVVDADMDNARAGVQTLFTYVKLAFSLNYGVQQEFGMRNYEKVSHNQSKFPDFIARACIKAALPDYATALLAKGYTSDMLSDLIAIKEKLSTDNSLQQTEIKGRVPETQTRITLNNAIWAVMSEVSMCSKEVYATDWGMQHLFLLYPNSVNTATPPVPPTTPVS